MDNFRETEIDKGFDSLVSVFIEESRIPETNEITYINHEMDSTFVHGKVHRRKYLINKNIRWNPDLTIHEDSYFNIQCQNLSKNVKYCQTPFFGNGEMSRYAVMILNIFLKHIRI